ncbi:MAG: GAF domain-containing protein [candidate division KSB1 bacterium]|nr:GAF domain-containing protein [candidate division KSB1 bacterium]
MRTTRRRESVEKLYRLTIELGTTLDEKREIQVFLRWVEQEANPQLAALYVVDDLKSVLEPVGAVGVPPAVLRTIPMGEDVWRHLENSTPKARVRPGQRYSVPLILEGQLFGFLAVVSAARGATLRSEKKLLATAAGYLAPILRNIWRYQSLEKQVRQRTEELVESERRHRQLAERLHLLREVDSAILEAKSVREVGQLVCRCLLQVVPGVFCVAILGIPGSVEEAEVLAAADRSSIPSLVPGMRVSLADIALRSGLEAKDLALHPVESSPDPRRITYMLAQLGFRRAMLCPIWEDAGVRGAIVLAGCEDAPWQEDYHETASAFCRSLAIAMRQEELREQVRSQHEELERKVRKRTEELQKLVNHMAGREIRMAELKEVIKMLRKQLLEAGLKPVVDDPLASPEESDWST